MISGPAGDKQPHGNLGVGVTAAGQLKDQPHREVAVAAGVLS
jgi:hypothetical protein